MVTVKIRGWRPGLIAIDLIQLIQTEQSIGLTEARRLAHAIIDNDPIEFEFETEERAELFRAKLHELGVKTEL